MNKQIDEMEKIVSNCIQKWLNNDTTKAISYYISEEIYIAGYRRASDVAEWIFAELKKAMIDEYRYPIIAELKEIRKRGVDKVKWLRQEPCPMTPEQFNEIYDDESEEADDENNS